MLGYLSVLGLFLFGVVVFTMIPTWMTIWAGLTPAVIATAWIWIWGPNWSEICIADRFVLSASFFATAAGAILITLGVAP